MNLCNAQAASQGLDSGAGGSLGTAAHAGPAHPITVGAVGFGPAWDDEGSALQLRPSSPRDCLLQGAKRPQATVRVVPERRCRELL